MALPARSHASVARYEAEVLIVDDDPGTLDTWSAFLRHERFRVSACSSAAKALQEVSGASFDVMIIDLKLPDASGIELIARLRSQGIVTPILIATAFPSVDTYKHALKLGAVEYLEKPLMGDDLVSAVRQACRRPRGGSSGTSIERATEKWVRGTPIDHAAEKWVSAVMRVLTSDHDPRTLAQWGRIVGASSGSLRNLCYLVKVAPRQSLRLARLLRAVVRAREVGWDPRYLLDISDRRTLTRFAKQLDPCLRSGTSRSTQAREFLLHQTLVKNERVLRQLEIALQRWEPDPGSLKSGAS